jgi:hypothetical protein
MSSGTEKVVGSSELESFIANLREEMGKDEEDALLLEEPSRPFLNRMDSFARGKNPGSFKDFSDDFPSEETFSCSPNGPKTNAGFSGMFGEEDSEEEDSKSGGLFDGADVEISGRFHGSGNFSRVATKNHKFDFERDLLGSDDQHDQGLYDTAGLDKLLEGRPSLNSFLGPGMLSEEDLVRTNVMAHRTKDEIAAILATVTAEVNHQLSPIETLFSFSFYFLIFYVLNVHRL